MLLSLSLVANEVMEGGPEAAEIRLVSLAGGGGVGVSLVLKAPSPGSSLWAWALTQQARVARHGVGISDCPLPVLTYAMFIYKTSRIKHLIFSIVKLYVGVRLQGSHRNI